MSALGRWRTVGYGGESGLATGTGPERLSAKSRPARFAQKRHSAKWDRVFAEATTCGAGCVGGGRIQQRKLCSWPPESYKCPT